MWLVLFSKPLLERHKHLSIACLSFCSNRERASEAFVSASVLIALEQCFLLMDKQPLSQALQQYVLRT